VTAPALAPTVAPGHGGQAGHAGQGGTSTAGQRETQACSAGTPQRSSTPSKPSGRPSQAMHRGPAAEPSSRAEGYGMQAFGLSLPL